MQKTLVSHVMTFFNNINIQKRKSYTLTISDLELGRIYVPKMLMLNSWVQDIFGKKIFRLIMEKH